MTEDAGRRVHDAITEAVQEANPGSIVTGYVLVVEALDENAGSAFVYDAAEGQPISTSIGLLELGRQFHLARVGDYPE